MDALQVTEQHDENRQANRRLGRGAEICGNPDWLATALGKIASAAQRIHNPDAERAPATAHMFIINPLSGERMDNLFSTHPATENRIAALRQMAAEFQAQPSPQPQARAETRQAPAREEPTPSRPEPSAGPWGAPPADAPQAPEGPEAPRPNPWGRNPTGPRKGNWS